MFDKISIVLIDFYPDKIVEKRQTLSSIINIK